MDMYNSSIADVKIVVPTVFCDHRGWLSETYNYKILSSFGVEIQFIQDVCVYNKREYTLRGLHFQRPPWAQAKLVRVGRGRILDVAVDLRQGSPTYKRYVAQVISAESRIQVLIPRGFAHGYLTLEPNTEVLYKVDNHYSPEAESGLLWNDPEIAIDWGISATAVFVSERDKKLPLFRNLSAAFE